MANESHQSAGAASKSTVPSTRDNTKEQGGVEGEAAHVRHLMGYDYGCVSLVQTLSKLWADQGRVHLCDQSAKAPFIAALGNHFVKCRLISAALSLSPADFPSFSLFL